MPMGTLSLPSCLIDAAKGYADKENLSLADLFARMLHCQYGYVMTVAVARPERKKFRISPRVRALRGVAKLDGAQPYRDIVAAELESRYTDFEGEVQLSEALAWRAEAVVTRDVRGFKASPIPVFRPSEFVRLRA